MIGKRVRMRRRKSGTFTKTPKIIRDLVDVVVIFPNRTSKPFIGNNNEIANKKLHYVIENLPFKGRKA